MKGCYCMSQNKQTVPLDTNRMARRYARHLSLPGIGADGQKRLYEARILLVGLGGLGSPAALYLNAAGVGTLGLADFDTVDVREPFELELCRIPDAVHIPLRDIPKRYAELPVERPLVMYCHKGMRSAMAAQQLREKGYKQVFNLSGGIDRWAQEMDPAMARY